ERGQPADRHPEHAGHHFPAGNGHRLFSPARRAVGGNPRAFRARGDRTPSQSGGTIAPGPRRVCASSPAPPSPPVATGGLPPGRPPRTTITPRPDHLPTPRRDPTHAPPQGVRQPP